MFTLASLKILSKKFILKTYHGDYIKKVNRRTYTITNKKEQAKVFTSVISYFNNEDIFIKEYV